MENSILSLFARPAGGGGLALPGISRETCYACARQIGNAGHASVRLGIMTWFYNIAFPTTAMDAHRELEPPSDWVCRYAPLIRAGGLVLDIACGGGRHARYLAGLGHRVEAVDRDPGALRRLADVAGVTTRSADLEGGPWPYAGRHFDAVIVANYLHRPLFSPLLAALAAGGVLIYETFAAGNERYGRPGNPDFLLKPGELLELARGLRVVAYEDTYVEAPRPAMIQRICAINQSSGA